MLPSNALLALAAAVLWGGGDFSGGMGAKYAGGNIRGAFRVVLTSHTAGLLVLLAIALLRGDMIPHGPALGWSMLSGLMGCVSVTAFYIALSRGAMGASAAVSGLLAAAIPSVVAISQSGWPGWLTVTGFVVAGCAIWLIAAGDNPEAKPESTSTIWLAVGSGAGFGIYFVALKYAAVAGLVWPMAVARLTSVVTSSAILLTMAWIATDEVRTDRAQWLSTRAVFWALLTALGDTSGNLLFMASTRAGRLDVAAVLSSLYPASTILLAAWALHEKPTRRQGIGMLVAAAAVVLITL